MEWRLHPLYDNYLVSNIGEVYNTKTRNFISHREKNKTGYILTNVQLNGKQKTVLNHRLVAQTYIPNPHNLPEIDHINGIRNDNRVENLQWVDRRTNCSKYWRIYDTLFDTYVTVRNLKEFAHIHGVGYPNLMNCVKGINNHSYGYIITEHTK